MKKRLLSAILYFSLLFFNSFAQNRKIDSLLTLIKSDKEDTSKVIHSNDLCWEFRNIGLYDTAIKYGNIALQLSQQLNFKKGLAGSYNNIGIVYHVQGYYPKALDFYLKALKINEEQKDKSGIAKCFSNIGNVYVGQGDYPQALEYYLKSLGMAESLNNKTLITSCLVNIGSVYYYQKDYPKALDNDLRALIIAEELRDETIQSNILNSIGLVYQKQGDYTKAFDYYFRALKMSEGIDNKNNISTVLGNIGTLYTATGKFKNAEQYLKRAIAINDSIGALDYLRQTEEALSQLYDITGQHKLALIHYKKAAALKDTIFSQENKKQLVCKEMNYEFDKKEMAANAEQGKKDAVTAEEKHRQKIITYSVIGGLFLVLLLALFILREYRQKRKANIIIELQKAEVEKQKELVEKKNKDITDSIDYAKTIQEATLPSAELLSKHFPDSFILFKPKDIVSGDFYWFAEKGGKRLIAACDCTGHGVPGALMSMIGNNILNQIVNEKEVTAPNEIINNLHKEIRKTLKQDKQNKMKDGMDAAIITFNNELEIEFAGAQRPIWIIRNQGEPLFIEIKGNKFAVGGLQNETERKFTNHTISLIKGDSVYIFSDGFADQFSENDKKIMTSRFKEILLGFQGKTMQEQGKYLDTFSDNWRGNREQIDDILVIGIRI